MSAPQAENRASALAPTERLKACARRAVVAAEAVETIAGMIDQLQQTAVNFGAAVDVRIEGEAISGRVMIGIDLAGVSARRGVPAVTVPASAETVVTFRHTAAAPEAVAEPAPEPSPTGEAHADTIQPPADPLRNSGLDWSDEDDLQLLAKDESGLTMRELAARLGRSPSSCWTRLQRLRADARAAPQEDAVIELVADTPAEPADELSRADLQVAERLRNLPAARGWNAARDLQLVEALTSGSKLPEVSKALNLPSIDCIGRYRMLCPTGGFEEQVQVLRVLRRIADEDRQREDQE